MMPFAHKLAHIGGAIATLIYLNACAAPSPLQGPGGAMNIMSLPVGFSVNNLPSGWTLSGRAGPQHISPSKVDPLHELTVISSDHGYTLTRMTDAVLLASPYLRWRWKVLPGAWKYHPLRLLVGFNGGSAEPAEIRSNQGIFSSNTSPGYDRGLSLAWGPSALMRGSLSKFDKNDGPVQEVQYTVRGGQETTREWKTETVDLSHLYAKSWPNDDIRKVKIVFVGIGVAKTDSPHYASIGDIQISR